MKIKVDQIPPEGMIQEEEISSQALELETDIVKFKGPVKIRAQIYKITNALTVSLTVKALMQLICGRCLEEFEVPIEKELKLNYSLEKNEHFVDLDPDIRQDIILDYPIKPLCDSLCKGLCLVCGENLNKGKCKCGK